MNGPELWFLNRATGVVLLVLMTLSVVLGILSARSRVGRGTPGFVRGVVHRNVAVLSMTMLTVHVVSAVVDTYVDIRWWDAFVPWGGLYQPVWLGLGALALDLTVAIAITSALRTRMPRALWRVIHLASYPAWAIAMVHGLGIGTDRAAGWSLMVTGLCIAAVVVAGTVRVGGAVVRAVRA